MNDDETRPWLRSEYPYEARDVYEAYGAMMHAIDEKLHTLDPQTMTAEMAHALQRWQEQRTVEPDFRRGLPLVFDHLKDLAVLLNDPALLRRVVWAMDAFQQWLQRVYDQQQLRLSGSSRDEPPAP